MVKKAPDQLSHRRRKRKGEKPLYDQARTHQVTRKSKKKTDKIDSKEKEVDSECLTFDTGMKYSEAKPVNVIVKRSKIVYMQDHRRPEFRFFVCRIRVGGPLSPHF